MKTLIIFSMLISASAFATPSGDLNLNANSLKLKIYRMAVSTSANCSSPVIVIDNGSTPQEVDVKGTSPRFGAGSIDNGTYPCVMFEMSDTIKYSGQASTSTNCGPSIETSRDLCRQNNGGSSTLLDGTNFTCTNSEDKIVMYASTNTVSSASGNAFDPPTSAGSQDGLHLGAPLNIAGTARAKLVVNTDGQLCDNGNATGSDCDGSGADNTCRLEGAEFSFVEL